MNIGDLASPEKPRIGRSPWIVWALSPFALAWFACLLLRWEMRSFVAPLMGPWAGLAFGHRDCTMATGLPGWTLATVTLGVIAVAACVFARHGPARVAGPVLIFLWGLLWVGLAILSVVNTLPFA